MTDTYDSSPVFQFVIATSAVMNLLFFSLMLWVDELRAHPMKLFMLLMACDASVLFCYFSSLKTCDFGTQKLLAWTFYFQNDCASQLKALEKIGKAAVFNTVFFTVASVCINICVCIDLILTIKRPFKAKEPRMPRYYICTFVVATMQATILTFFYMDEDVLTIGEWIGSGAIVVLWILSVGSIVYGLVKLCQPGISREVRNVIMARHVVTILFFVIGNLYL